MLFSFNEYSGLLLPCFVQGVIFMVILTLRARREEQVYDYFLAAILVVYTLRITQWMLGYADWYDTHDWHTTFMFYMPFNLWLFLGPLVYFYFKSLTSQSFRFRQKDLWHVVPGLLVLAFDGIVALYDLGWKAGIQGETLPYFYETNGWWNYNLPDWIYLLQSVAMYLSVFVYFGLTIRDYQQYRQYVKTHFSNDAPVNFGWLRNVLYAMIFGQVVMIGFDVYEWVKGESLTYSEYWIAFFLWGVIIYYLSIQGYGLDRSILFKLQFEEKEAIDTETTSPSGLAARLNTFLDTQQPYLNPNLSLVELADQLSSTPTQLSQTINRELGQNFHELINSYRIEEVKRQLLDPARQHLSILGIAFESGFNSKATFNRVFKQMTGQTPSAFQKSHKNQVSVS